MHPCGAFLFSKKRRGRVQAWQKNAMGARTRFVTSCAIAMSARSACLWMNSKPRVSIAHRRRVSRDIAEMGLRKLPEGVYVLAEDLHLQRMVSELVVDVHRADNMLIVKAQPGTANGIAAAIDAAELPDVLGSLAGNDTIFVVSQTGEDSQRLEALLQKLRCAKS